MPKPPNEKEPLSDLELGFVQPGGTSHWLVDRVEGTLTAIGGEWSGKVVRRFSSSDVIDKFIRDNGISARER